MEKQKIHPNNKLFMETFGDKVSIPFVHSKTNLVQALFNVVPMFKFGTDIPAALDLVSKEKRHITIYSGTFISAVIKPSPNARILTNDELTEFIYNLT